MMRSVRGRVFIACVCLTVVFTIFSYRLVRLQLAMHEFYVQQANKKHGKAEPIAIRARRGQIQDVHGEVLADNEPLRLVFADGSLLRKNQFKDVAELLAAPLGFEESALESKLVLTGTRKFEVLKAKVPEQTAMDLEAQLRSRKLFGINFRQDSGRIYPNGTMLCHVLGCLDSERKPIGGVEKSMDEYLRGHDGYRYTEHDRKGNELVMYRGQERAPRNGANVRLTIDMGLQAIVEEELENACKNLRPKKAIAVMMRPGTGEILAMANRPAFDLNSSGKDKSERMENGGVASMFEPGSTFKIVTVAAALNEQAAKLDTIIFCENGLFRCPGKPLKDSHPHGDLSVREVLGKSSNIGTAKLAMRLGEQTFYEYVRRFGFGERTGINLPGEINGQVHPPYTWSKTSITRIPMGQGVTATPVQMISAMCAVANGGNLMLPQIVREVVDDSGNTLIGFEPVKVRQVVTPETAAMVREALKDVVSEQGTAAKAKVKGFAVAGKTGTAQKPDGKGGYMEGKWIVSFIGFLPADNPAFACLVMMDEPMAGKEYFGGSVAGPVFSLIAERAARYLNLEPEPEALPGQLVLNKE